jgi:hypothetical protein
LLLDAAEKPQHLWVFHPLRAGVVCCERMVITSVGLATPQMQVI